MERHDVTPMIKDIAHVGSADFPAGTKRSTCSRNARPPTPNEKTSTRFAFTDVWMVETRSLKKVSGLGQPIYQIWETRQRDLFRELDARIDTGDGAIGDVR